MMAKSLFKLAVEELDAAEVTEVDSVITDPVDDGQVITELEESSIDAQADQIDEAETILETTTNIESDLTKCVDTGEGATSEQIEKMEIAVEYFSRRMGLTKSMVPAKENFSDPATRLVNTKLALESVQRFNKVMSKNLVVAKEGLFSRIFNAIERGFTSEDKVKVGYETASAAFSAEVSKDMVFEDPAWGRVFAISGKTKVDASDIASTVQNLTKVINDDAVYACKKITEILNKIAIGLNKSVFIANDRVVADFNKLVNDAMELHSSHGLKAFNKESSVVVVAADEFGKKKLDVAMRAFVNSKEIDNACEHLDLAMDNYYNAYITGMETRFRGEQAADFRAANTLIYSGIDQTVTAVYDILNTRWKMMYGCYKYMKAMAS